MKLLIPWIAGWIVFCGGVAVTCIAIEVCTLRTSMVYESNYSRIYEVTAKAFVFAVVGMVLGTIGLLVCR